MKFYSQHIYIYKRQLTKNILQISSQLEQIDQLTMDILSYKSKCDDQERDLEKLKSQLSHGDYNTVLSQLAAKESLVNELKNEVSRSIFFHFYLKFLVIILSSWIKFQIKERVSQAMHLTDGLWFARPSDTIRR